jgi:hypothetical protein
MKLKNQVGKMIKTINKILKLIYKLSFNLCNLKAVIYLFNGKYNKVIKRLINILIGKNLIRKIWFK